MFVCMYFQHHNNGDVHVDDNVDLYDDYAGI